MQLVRTSLNQYSVPIDATTTAADVPGWDSLNHVMLMMEIEQKFNVILDPQKTAQLENLGMLHEEIVNRIDDGSPSTEASR